MDQSNQKFYKPFELAKRYGVNPRTIYRWAEEGKLKGFRPSTYGGWRFTEEEVQRFEGRSA